MHFFLAKTLSSQCNSSCYYNKINNGIIVQLCLFVLLLLTLRDLFYDRPKRNYHNILKARIELSGPAQTDPKYPKSLD